LEKIMSLLHPLTFEFLKALKEKNNREYFETIKPLYEEIKKEFENVVWNLIREIEKFDKRIEGVSVKESVFRIYRDARFSKDKSPYKTRLGAHIAQWGRKSSQAWYYLQIQPGETILAWGIYRPTGEELSRLRAFLSTHYKEYNKIITNSDFKKTFGEIDGESLKRPPKGYDLDHPAIEILKRKQHLVRKKYSDADVLSWKFIPKISKDAQIAYPFFELLNRGIAFSSK
jgi:uncharacterized protein (TIGR02453 family)